MSRVIAAGAIALHAHAVAVELHLGDDRQRRDAGLRRAVVGLADVAEQPRRRRRVDHRRLHRRARLGQVAPVRGGEVQRDEVALEVDVDDRVPLGLGHVGDHAVAQDARVVDEHVQLAERVDRGLDQALAALPVGAAVGVRHRLAAHRLDLLDHLLRGTGVGARRRPRAPPRSLTTTLAPSRAKSSACSRPIPRPAPVMTATRPSSVPIAENSPVDRIRAGRLAVPRWFALPSRHAALRDLRRALPLLRRPGRRAGGGAAPRLRRRRQHRLGALRDPRPPPRRGLPGDRVRRPRARPLRQAARVERLRGRRAHEGRAGAARPDRARPVPAGGILDGRAHRAPRRVDRSTRARRRRARPRRALLGSERARDERRRRRDAHRRSRTRSSRRRFATSARWRTRSTPTARRCRRSWPPSAPRCPTSS